jgi:arabinogalactan endo-1,4-beta-galactosidase
MELANENKLEPSRIINVSSNWVIGADVSHLLQLEDCGALFYDDGIQRDCLAILKKYGFNAVRIKVWNDPGNPDHYPSNQSDPHGYNNKEHVIELAGRAYRMGFRIMIDFHYSDWWADPAKQYTPYQWENLALNDLENALYNHTCDVLGALKQNHVMVEWVQVGNEITNGMMWDMGSTVRWDNLAKLLQQGYRAVKNMDWNTKVVLHLDQGGDREICRRWFDNATARWVEFDVIGLSYYPVWHGSLTDLENNMHDLAVQYRKEIIVVETAYPWTDQNGDEQANTFTNTGPVTYPMSPEGQKQFLDDLAGRIKRCPQERGRGFFYWEPEMIPVPGAGWKLGAGDEWDNVTLFDFQGNVLPALKKVRDY